MRNETCKVMKYYQSGVTLTEFLHIEDFNGDFDWGLPTLTDKNIYFWFNLSREAITTIEGLVKDKIIEIAPSNLMNYMYGGAVPHVPIAKQLGRAYKDKRWYPIAFNLVKRS